MPAVPPCRSVPRMARLGDDPFRSLLLAGLARSAYGGSPWRRSWSLRLGSAGGRAAPLVARVPGLTGPRPLWRSRRPAP